MQAASVAFVMTQIFFEDNVVQGAARVQVQATTPSLRLVVPERDLVELGKPCRGIHTAAFDR
jgi:hypothetical protein